MTPNTNTSLLNMPGKQLPYPKYESHCHGAPVYKLDHQRKKYVCIECADYCIPREKKMTNTFDSKLDEILEYLTLRALSAGANGFLLEDYPEWLPEAKQAIREAAAAEALACLPKDKTLSPLLIQTKLQNMGFNKAIDQTAAAIRQIFGVGE